MGFCTATQRMKLRVVPSACQLHHPNFLLNWVIQELAHRKIIFVGDSITSGTSFALKRSLDGRNRMFLKWIVGSYFPFEYRWDQESRVGIVPDSVRHHHFRNETAPLSETLQEMFRNAPPGSIIFYHTGAWWSDYCLEGHMD